MPGCPRSSVAAHGTQGAESASGRGWLARTLDSWGISTSVRNRQRPSLYPENATWQMQDPEAITPQPGDGSRALVLVGGQEGQPRCPQELDDTSRKGDCLSWRDGNG